MVFKRLFDIFHSLAFVIAGLFLLYDFFSEVYALPNLYNFLVMADQEKILREYERFSDQINASNNHSDTNNVPRPPRRAPIPPPPPPPQPPSYPVHPPSDSWPQRGMMYPQYPFMPYYPSYYPHPQQYSTYATSSASSTVPSGSGVDDGSVSDALDDDRVEDLDSEEADKKTIDLDDPGCKFSKVCSKRNKVQPVSPFVLEQWKELKGFDSNGMFDIEKYPKENAWKKFKPVSALVDFHGNSLQFGPPIAEAELSLSSSGFGAETEKELKVLQKQVGAVSHLLLQSQEGFETNYRKMRTLMESCPLDLSVPENQTFKANFDALCEESIKNVSGNIARATRIGAALHTDLSEKRRKLYVKEMKKSHSAMVTDQLEKIPPSLTHLFSKRIGELEKSFQMDFLSKVTTGRTRDRYSSGFSTSKTAPLKRKADFRNYSGDRKKSFSAPHRGGKKFVGGSGFHQSGASDVYSH